MVWWPFMLQFTSNWLQPTLEGPKPDTDRSSTIQTHTAVEYFTGRRLPAATRQLQSSTRLSPGDVNAGRSWFYPLHLSSALHRFYLFIVITVCYLLHHCFRFTHLDPLTPVWYYSTWVSIYLEEEEACEVQRLPRVNLDWMPSLIV